MRSFLPLMQHDLFVLSKSWAVRFWLMLTGVGGIMAVVVSKNYIDETSFLMGWALVMYAGLGSFVSLVISTSAISAELPFLGEAIVSRGIAPTSYLVAKMVSRAIGVLFMFLVIIVPTVVVLEYQALNPDMSTWGIIVALIYWSLMLLVLVLLGITFSVLFSNTLVGVVVLGVLWYISLALLVLVHANGFTPEGVLGGLPLVLQGKSLLVEIETIMTLGVVPIIILPFVAIKLFNRRDL